MLSAMSTNRIKRALLFYATQIVLLGSVGCSLWFSYGWWKYGFFWTADTVVVWLFTLLLVGVFVLIVCAPVQWVAVKLKNRKCAYFFGLLSGPVAVLLFLAVFTHYQVDFYNYFYRQ